jgi:hypothetical protein
MSSCDVIEIFLCVFIIGRAPMPLIVTAGSETTGRWPTITGLLVLLGWARPGRVTSNTLRAGTGVTGREGSGFIAIAYL